ncbi:MAG TPA: hypothetical protein VFL93_12480 [Longimicrobiaceae bacterium]|nr:hypothetical protein [Longimicrobiaceae bacterium]
MNTSKILGALCLGLIASTGACNENSSPTQPTTATSGTLRATYSGDLSGSVDAEGAFDPQTIQTFGVAFHDPQRAMYEIVGLEVANDFSGEEIVLLTESASAGTYSLSSDCGASASDLCAQAFLVTIDDVRLQNPAIRQLRFDSGTVTLQAGAAQRVTGTFGGTALETNTAGDTLATVAVSDGSYDVPIVEAQITPTTSLSPVNGAVLRWPRD